MLAENNQARSALHLPDGMPDLSTQARTGENAALLHESLLALTRRHRTFQKMDGTDGYLWKGSLRAVMRDCWDAFDGLDDNSPSDEACKQLTGYLERSGNLLRWLQVPETWWVRSRWRDGPLLDDPPARDRGPGCQFPGCQQPHGVSGNGLTTTRSLHQHAALMHGLTARQYDWMVAGETAWPPPEPGLPEDRMLLPAAGADFADVTPEPAPEPEPELPDDYRILASALHTLADRVQNLIDELRETRDERDLLRAAARVNASQAELAEENAALREEKRQHLQTITQLRQQLRSAELILGTPLVE